MNNYNGFFRAKVVDNNDPDMFGRVKVWIPDLMPEINDDEGIWAYSANNPIGGRNTNSNIEDNYFMGSSFIPPNGCWLWIFFELQNINRPYYFTGLNIQNAKVLPENQLGSNPSNKWVIFKSKDGRSIIISDDKDDARVEITGKKRKINSPPVGDTDSVYEIDDNQSTILFDEREGKEKILIRTYKGDFFHIDVDEQKLQIQFESDILIKTNSDFNIKAKNINLNSDGKINLESKENMNLKSTGSINIDSIDELNLNSSANVALEGVMSVDVKSTGTLNQQSVMPISLQSTSMVSIDAPLISENGGMSSPASSSGSADSANDSSPEGERDT